MNGDSFDLKVSIPVNTTAKVYLPAQSCDVVYENGIQIKKLNEIEIVNEIYQFQCSAHQGWYQ